MTDSPDNAVIIIVDDLGGPEIAGLLQRHLDFVTALSPIESVHALDINGLKNDAITFWSAWLGPGQGLAHGKNLVGCVALKELDTEHGEIKSMHTAIAARGRGIGRKLLLHLIGEAEKRAYRRLSLETGTSYAFEPARSLYRNFGFETCPPFADYFDDPHSTCMTRRL